jgi:hypothetical protein
LGGTILEQGKHFLLNDLTVGHLDPLKSKLATRFQAAAGCSISERFLVVIAGLITGK